MGSLAASPAREGGKTWEARPYVRVGEREVWNRVYFRVETELKILRRYASGIEAVTDEGIDTAAWNIAYRTIWDARATA